VLDFAPVKQPCETTRFTLPQSGGVVEQPRGFPRRLTCLGCGWDSGLRHHLHVLRQPKDPKLRSATAWAARPFAPKSRPDALSNG
jgi:hypothetical protein